MSSKCLKCFKPAKSCLCSFISPIDPDVKFVFLMHPHEAYKERTGTGRLTSLSLFNSEIIIDSSFDENKRTQELINDDNYFKVVLYPDDNPYFAESLDYNKVLNGKKLLVFLIDATWIMAKKMMYRSPTLQKLPKLSFSREYVSNFQFKKQPAKYCLSTIESTYYLIKELQKAGITPSDIKPEGLMDVFSKMVKFQLDCEKRYSKK